MSVLDTLRADALSARKARDPMAPFLMTVISDADSKAKDQGKPVSDAQVVEIVQKFIKGLDENIRLTSGAPEKIAAYTAQKDVLSAYLPQQMTADEIRAYAEAKKAEGMNMGQIMGALKADHAGRYDGRTASGIVKDVAAS